MPQPPFTAEAFRLALLMVVMCFKMDTSFVFSRRETFRAGAVSCYYSQYTILCRIFQVLIEIFLGEHSLDFFGAFRSRQRHGNPVEMSEPLCGGIRALPRAVGVGHGAFPVGDAHSAPADI